MLILYKISSHDKMADYYKLLFNALHRCEVL